MLHRILLKNNIQAWQMPLKYKLGKASFGFETFSFHLISWMDIFEDINLLLCTYVPKFVPVK